MCKCRPEVRTPFCGKGDCKWPDQKHQEGQRAPEGLLVKTSGIPVVVCSWVKEPTLLVPEGSDLIEQFKKSKP